MSGGVAGEERRLSPLCRFEPENAEGLFRLLIGGSALTWKEERKYGSRTARGLAGFHFECSLVPFDNLPADPES